MNDVFDYSEHMIEIVALHKRAREHLLNRQWEQANVMLSDMLMEVLKARNFCIEMEQKEKDK